MIKRNWFFLLIIAGMLLIFARRYSYLETAVVSNPDSQIAFRTEDGVLEQTWQPEVKMITGISLSYYAENDFTSDVQIEIYSDDYSKVLGRAIQKTVFREGESGEIIFDLGKTKIVQGERYRMRLSLLEPSEEGTLQISSGSNYGGCSISGKDVGQAAAFRIMFAKSSRLFWLMAVLFPIFAYSLFMMVVTGRKWEETVAVSIFLEGFILYFFGLAEHLRWGLIGIYVLGAVAFFTAIHLYNKKKLTVNSLLSFGFWIYMALFLVILVTGNGDWLGMRDDMRHWGIAVRDMFYYDSFAKHIDTTVILPRYLPFTTLIEYLFEYANGTFHEGILLVAYQTMMLSVSIIFCRLLQKRGRKKFILPVSAAMICIPVLFFHNISSTIMVDSLMALMMAYSLICYYSEEMSWFNRIRICSTLCALALTKEIGLVLAGLAALIMFGDIFFEGLRKKKISFKQLLYPVVCVCLVLGLYFSWQAYLSIPPSNHAKVSAVEKTNQEADKAEEQAEAVEKEKTVEKKETAEQSETAFTASGITLEGLKNIFTGKGEWYQYQVSRNFITALLDGETFPVGTIKLSFVDFLYILVFLIGSLAFFEYWRIEKERKFIFAIMTLVAGGCFCVFLQVTYWFTFGMYEAMDLTSFDRYLAPFLCAVMMAEIYLIFEGEECSPWGNRKSGYLIYTLTLIMIIVMPVEGLVFESNDLEENTTQENTYGYDNIAEILRSMAGRGERAYFICSNSDGYTEYIFRNAVCPIISEHANWNIVSDKELYDKQYEIYAVDEINVNNTANIVPANDLEEEIKKCQYVVVFHADELFKQSYSELFEDTTIQDGSIYQVAMDANDMTLYLVGSTEIRGYH